MVKLLLGRKDVNPDSSTILGRTPLSLVAENGYEGIAKLLLEREDVNPNIPDTVYGSDGHDHDRSDYGGHDRGVGYL